MRENDLGVLSGFKGEESNAFGEFEENIFLDDTVDELVDLFGAAVDF